MSVDSATGTAARNREATRHSRTFSDGHVIEILVAPRSATKLGCATTVTRCRRSRRCCRREPRRRARCGPADECPPTASADSVTTSWAAVTQCTANGAAVGVALRDPFGQAGQVEIGVVQNPFAGAKAVHALVQIAVSMGLHKPHHVADVHIRRRVGHARDPVCTQPSADLDQLGIVALQCIRPLRSALRSRPSG